MPQFTHRTAKIGIKPPPAHLCNCTQVVAYFGRPMLNFDVRWRHEHTCPMYAQNNPFDIATHIKPDIPHSGMTAHDPGTYGRHYSASMKGTI